jgi:hypothetical protein
LAHHYIHWLNNTKENVKAHAYHDWVKRSYFKTTCKKNGGRGESYKPSFQDFEWTIRFYDEYDDTFLAAYQYLCVKDDSFVVELYKEGNDYKIGIIFSKPQLPCPIERVRKNAER